jgi:hypothetical protein
MPNITGTQPEASGSSGPRQLPEDNTYEESEYDPEEEEEEEEYDDQGAVNEFYVARDL